MLGIFAISVIIAAVEVTSDGDCPKATAVSAELGRLLPELEANYRLQIARTGNELKLALHDSAGAIVAARELDARGTCAELAAAIAVATSTWLLELDPPQRTDPEPPTTDADTEPTPADRPKGTRAPVLANTHAGASAPNPRAGSPAKLPRDAPRPAQTSAATEAPLSTTTNSPALRRAARHEAALLYSSGFNTGYSTANGAALSLSYWFFEGIAFELHAELLTSSDSGISRTLELIDPGRPLNLDDMTELRSNFTAGIATSLARAPSSFFGLTDTELELLLFFGAGAASTRRQNTFGEFESGGAALLAAGAGLRVYLVPTLLALRVEIRDLFFPEQSENGSGFTHHTQLELGLQLSTDPEAWSVRPIGRLDRPSFARNFVFEAKIGTSFADTWVTTRAAGAAISYYFVDALALELTANYLAPEDSSFAREVLDKYKSQPDLANMTQLLWAAGAGLRADFLRGRFIPFGTSNFDGDFSFYALAGVGIGATRVQCTPGLELDPEVHGEGARCPMLELGPGEQNTTFTPVYEPARSQILIQLGVGARLGLADTIGLTIALRDWMFDTRVRRPGTIDPIQMDTSARRHILLAELGISVAL